jgi:hypothetical protein
VALLERLRRAVTLRLVALAPAATACAPSVVYSPGPAPRGWEITQDTLQPLTPAPPVELAGTPPVVRFYWESPKRPAEKSLTWQEQALLLKDSAGVVRRDVRGRAFVDGAGWDDPIQGSLGDCWLVAALVAVARSDPGLLEGNIEEVSADELRALGGDPAEVGLWFRVYLYELRDGVRVRDFDYVKARFPIRRARNRPLYARSRQPEELWASLFELAVVRYQNRTIGLAERGYAAVDGGSPRLALELLTGRPSRSMSANDLAGLEEALEAGQAVVATTHDQPKLLAGTGIDPSHAFGVRGLRRDDNGRVWVRLREPDGYDEPPGNGPRDGIFEITWAQFTRYFDRINAA